MSQTILVVDDEASIRETISDILQDQDYSVVLADNGEDALKLALYEDIDSVILDVMMPKKGGMEVLEILKRDLPLIPVIVVSGHGDIKMAVEAMKKGAFDFIEKPLSFERILSSVRNSVTLKELRMENMNLKSKLDKTPPYIGESQAIQMIMEHIDQISESDASVLITGENGTGKEVMARQIHARSTRRRGPFIGVNCAAIPDTLIESELFGYERGAFTGAVKQKKGKLECAHHGTLFLDEVGDLSLPAQAKLLRALQEHSIERVGGHETISLDVRILAATNQNLPEAIRTGRFRQDLYYRLNVIPIYLPPLRERKEDIQALARYFLEELNEKNSCSKTLSRQAMQALTSRSWPGNARELRNFIERLCILVRNPNIEASDVLRLLHPDEAAMETEVQTLSLKDARARFEKQLILDRLISMNNNVSKTAESLGLDRTHLYRKMNELGLNNHTNPDEEEGSHGIQDPA